jgi:hypothetical protein
MPKVLLRWDSGALAIVEDRTQGDCNHKSFSAGIGRISASWSRSCSLPATPIREKRLVPLLPNYPLPKWPINLLYSPLLPELSPENRLGLRNLS